MISQSPESKNDCELNVSTQWNNLSIYDEQKTTRKNENSVPFIDDKALRMMHKMGYKTGSGLGKNEQGITTAIDVTCHLGKRGLGLNIKGVEAKRETWDFSKEEINVEEEVIWLENQESENETENFASFFKNRTTWIKEGPPKYDIENETHFCDKDVLHEVLQAKTIFDELNLDKLNRARLKANPFETVGSVFFMNRAALKMANIDAATGFMFTNVNQNEHHKHKGPYYFADVCAGPGGFSEYILWRKGWNFKGFGLTLKVENDFKLQESSCASSATFQPLYGKLGDGDIYCPDNIIDFKEKVMHGTEGRGVHFMMSDGGFSVKGEENLQEVLSKNIYICQCLVALEIVREHGHFVTKIFDVFTPFSVGLLYLTYKCFKKVTILKPNSSRPANAERYFICSDLRKDPIVDEIKEYMWIIVRRLWEKKNVLDIVPLEVIKKDEKFYSYIVKTNNSLGRRQIEGLKDLAKFCRNPNLAQTRQDELRKQCLKYWRIPDMKATQIKLEADDLFSLVINKPEIITILEILSNHPRELNTREDFKSTISDCANWHYCPMNKDRIVNKCTFYAGVGKSVAFEHKKGNSWKTVRHLQLVKGTILYGEFVQERQISKRNSSLKPEEESDRYSLHVIDALRLGNINLLHMKFEERMELIEIYCKSVNKEPLPNSVRIRPKVIRTLSSIVTQPLFKKKSKIYISSLPVIGYNTFSEVFHVNSLLLLKINDDHSFQSIYTNRVEMYVEAPEDQKKENILSFENLINEINEK